MPGVSNPSGLIVRYGTPPDQFNFPVTIEPVRVSMAPVYDQAERVVVGTKYTISLRTVIYPLLGDTSAAEQMTRLKAQLTKPAGELYVVGTGFGTTNLIVNRQGSNVWDMAWGPKPRLLECTQIGNDLAWQIAWQCETVVPECPTEQGRNPARPFEWNYTVAWDVDQKGLTKRTVSGHVKIPLTRLTPASTAVPDSADSLREQVKNLSVPRGFRRTPGRAELSADRRTLTFSLTDEQLESPYSPPPGIVLVSARHDVNNTQQFNFLRNLNTISANYTASLDTPRSIAWEHFTGLLFQRRRHAKDRGCEVMLLTLRGSDSIYETTNSFAATYIAMRKAEPGNEKIVTKHQVERYPFVHGFWTAPPMSEWKPWHDSLVNGAWESRGHAKMAYDVSDDKLLTVCQPPGQVLSVLNGDVFHRLRLSDSPGEVARRRIEVKAEEDEIPDGSASWLSYDATVTVRQLDEVVPMKLLPTAAKEIQYASKTSNVNSSEGYRPVYKDAGVVPHVVQIRAQPTYLVVLEGRAVRVRHSIEPPTILSAGGQKAYQYDRDGDDYFSQQIVAGLLTPVVAASWKQTYLVEATPKRAIRPADHPIYGRLEGDDGLVGFVVG